MNKPAKTSEPIHPLLADRWSPCAFAADRPVAPAQRTALLEAARWTPSCYGVQPWYFVVCDKSTHPQHWQRALACLADPNQAWAKNAPLLLLVCGDTLFAHNGQDNRHHAYDSGAAAMSLVLEAENQGLRAHQMGGFDADKARETFQVPAQCVCLSMIAVGYQAAADTLPEPLQARDEAARSRKPLEENFFFGNWGGRE